MAFEGRHLNKGRHQALKLEGLSGPNAKKRGGDSKFIFIDKDFFGRRMDDSFPQYSIFFFFDPMEIFIFLSEDFFLPGAVTFFLPPHPFSHFTWGAVRK